MDFNVIDLIGGDDCEANMQLADPGLLRYYKNRQDRIIYIDTELKDEALECQKEIIGFNVEDKNIPIEKRKPIKLLINSPGGWLTETMSLAHIIKMSKTPVYTYNIGESCSGAFIVLISGHKRFTLPGAYALYHRGQGAVGGSFDDAMSASKQYKDQVDQMQDWVIANTKIKKATLTRKKSADWWMNDKEQIENGVVDKLIESIDEIVG